MKAVDYSGNEVEVEVEYKHYRTITDQTGIDEPPRRGKPEDWELVRYSRSRRKEEDGNKAATIGFWYDVDVTDDLVNDMVRKCKPCPKGGKTVCIVTHPDGNKAEGIALCSWSDCFSYKMGRDISLGRALKQLGLGRYTEFVIH